MSNYNLFAIKMGLVPPKEKKIYSIPKQSEKKKQQVKDEKPGRDLQNEWFAAIEAKEFSKGYCNCWNCGEKILRAFARTAIAHVLPKRKNQFPSVKTHPFNYLILGAGCGCHQDYDASWQDASQMNIWGEALRRFEIIQPDIKDSTPIPDVFIKPSVLIASKGELNTTIIERA